MKLFRSSYNTNRTESKITLLPKVNEQDDIESSNIDADTSQGNGGTYFMKYFISVLCNLGLANMFANRTLLNAMMACMSKSVDGLEWSSKQKGVIFSAYFWSFTIFLIPSGILATTASSYKLLAICNLIVSILSIASPYVVKNLNYVYYLFIRTLMGVLHAPFNPVVYTIIQNWSTKYSKTRMVSIAASGFNLGNMISHLLGGISVSYFNWEVPFYAIGILGLLWSAAWLFFMTNTPRANRFISKNELQEITRYNESVKVSFADIPWKAIYSCPKIWAIFFTSFCNSWCIYTMTIELPTYFIKVFNLDISKSILFSVCPAIVSYVTTIVAAMFIDHLIAKNYFSIKMIRKITTCIAFIGHLIFILLSIHAKNEIYLTIYMIFAYCFLELNFLGFYTEVVEISGPYSGIVNSINIISSNMSGVISPLLTGILTPNNTHKEWSIVFYIVALFDLIGFSIYALCPSNKFQWSRPL